jgi:acetyl esterase/lipase
MQFGASQDAVVVSPEYRLLPEASGSDLFDDVAQFWTWIHTSFPAILSGIWPGLFVDFDRIAAAGESAGGYLALQSATLFPAAGIKLVMAQYCALDIENPAYNPVPSALPANNDWQVYLSSMKSDSIRLSSPFPEKLGLLQAVIGAGRHREFIGLDDRMNIRNSIRLAEELPAIWIAQGMDDTLVGNPPLFFYRCRILEGGTRKMYDANISDQVPKPVADDLVSYIRETHPETPLVYSVQPGGHGFDVECTLEESWVVEGIGFAKRYW